MAKDTDPLSITIDFSRPSPEADCLDCLIAFPLAIEQMRAESDTSRIPRSMMTRTRDAFRALDAKGGEGGLLFVAGAAQDRLYRHVASLTILDRYTREYVRQAVCYFFVELLERKISTFYILDNALREDRFESLLELFNLAGITIATPRRDGEVWSHLRKKIEAALTSGVHVAYVEPDDMVNHIESAKRLADGSTNVATFRNRSPDDDSFEVISLH